MTGRLKIRPAFVFLTADEDKLGKLDPRQFDRAWVGLLVLSALWGLLTVGLWYLAWWLFGDPGGFYPLQALAVAAAILLGLYRRSAGAMVALLAGPDRTSRAMLAAVTAVGLTTCLMLLRPDWHQQEYRLADWAAWLRPDSKIDRLLLLMPLWGAWSMLILPQFRRPGDSDCPAAAMVRGCGPLTAAVMMGLLLGGSIGYFAYLPWTQLTISGAGILAAIGGGLILARRNGGMDRGVMLAVNLLSQLVVLLAFLANRNL